MADQRQRFREQRTTFADHYRRLGGPLADERPNAQSTVMLSDLAELAVDPVDVDQVRRVGQAQAQEWHQALAASQHLGFITVFAQEIERFVERAGSVVRKRRWLHERLPCA